MKTRIIKVDREFPLSELFAKLGLYSLNERIIGNSKIVEMSYFDFIIFEAYIKESGINGVNVV